MVQFTARISLRKIILRATLTGNRLTGIWAFKTLKFLFCQYKLLDFTEYIKTKDIAAPTSWSKCIIVFGFSGLNATCIFPKFLQSGIKDGELQPWKTRTWWINLRNEPRWKERVEVYVQSSNMWYQKEVENIQCEKKSRRVTNDKPSYGKCITRSLLYNTTCLIQDGNDKFRVLQSAPGRYKRAKYISADNEVYIS